MSLCYLRVLILQQVACPLRPSLLMMIITLKPFEVSVKAAFSKICLKHPPCLFILVTEVTFVVLPSADGLFFLSKLKLANALRYLLFKIVYSFEYL